MDAGGPMRARRTNFGWNRRSRASGQAILALAFAWPFHGARPGAAGASCMEAARRPAEALRQADSRAGGPTATRRGSRLRDGSTARDPSRRRGGRMRCRRCVHQSTGPLAAAAMWRRRQGRSPVPGRSRVRSDGPVDGRADRKKRTTLGPGVGRAWSGPQFAARAGLARRRRLRAHGWC